MKSLRRDVEILAKNPRFLLALDFDGTLVPLQKRARPARLLAGQRHLLEDLGANPGMMTAIVSGRQLKDLSMFKGVPVLTLVGSHGLESTLPQLQHPAAAIRRWKRQAQACQKVLAPLWPQFPEARLEDKGICFSIHFRFLSRNRRKTFFQQVRMLVPELDFDGHFGKNVFEARPRSPFHKGWALQRMYQHLAGGKTFPSVLYIGDDTTDEDAFRVLKVLGHRAMGIKIGHGPTEAAYRLKSPNDVWKLLHDILDMRTLNFGAIR